MRAEELVRRVRPWLVSLGRLAWQELEILVVLLLVAAGMLGFVALAGEVSEGETRAFDEALLLALRTPGDRSDPLGPGWFEEMMRDFSALGGHALLGLLTLWILGYLAIQRQYRAACLVLASVVGAMALSTVLKLGFQRPRPDLVPHGSIVYTASFPSGHSMLSASVYLTLGALLVRLQPRRRLKLYVMSLAALLTLLVGVSRVYLGVHWPTDVLAGWTAGAAWALSCWLVALILKRRGRLETSAAPTEAGRAGER